LGNSHTNFQLHKITKSEISPKVLGGYFFDSHCTEVEKLCTRLTSVISMRKTAMPRIFCSQLTQPYSDYQKTVVIFFTVIILACSLCNFTARNTTTTTTTNNNPICKAPECQMTSVALLPCDRYIR